MTPAPTGTGLACRRGLSRADTEDPVVTKDPVIAALRRLPARQRAVVALRLDPGDGDGAIGFDWHVYGTLPDGDRVVVTDVQGAARTRPTPLPR